MSHEFAPAVGALVTAHVHAAAFRARPLDLAQLITGPSRQRRRFRGRLPVAA